VLSARLRAKPRHDIKDVAYLLKKSPALAETNMLEKGYDSNKFMHCSENKVCAALSL
jgi:hypothetical protein